MSGKPLKRQELAELFSPGAKPTGRDFSRLFDSFVSHTEDGLQVDPGKRTVEVGELSVQQNAHVKQELTVEGDTSANGQLTVQKQAAVKGQLTVGQQVGIGTEPTPAALTVKCPTGHAYLGGPLGGPNLVFEGVEAESGNDAPRVDLWAFGVDFPNMERGLSIASAKLRKPLLHFSDDGTVQMAATLKLLGENNNWGLRIGADGELRFTSLNHNATVLELKPDGTVGLGAVSGTLHVRGNAAGRLVFGRLTSNASIEARTNDNKPFPLLIQPDGGLTEIGGQRGGMAGRRGGGLNVYGTIVSMSKGADRSFGIGFLETDEARSSMNGWVGYPADDSREFSIRNVDGEITLRTGRTGVSRLSFGANGDLEIFVQGGSRLQVDRRGLNVSGNLRQDGAEVLPTGTFVLSARESIPGFVKCDDDREFAYRDFKDLYDVLKGRGIEDLGDRDSSDHPERFRIRALKPPDVGRLQMNFFLWTGKFFSDHNPEF